VLSAIDRARAPSHRLGQGWHGCGCIHLGKLGRRPTGDLGHAQLLELSLELIQLAEEVLPRLVPQLVRLDLDCADEGIAVSTTLRSGN
jgi:hypothetical protein